MMTENVQYTNRNTNTRTMPVWRRQALTIGAVWFGLGLVAAVFGPHGATDGLMRLVGGFGGWMFIGLGLMAAYLAGHIGSHRYGRVGGVVSGGLGLLVAGTLAVAIDWNTILQSALSVIGFGLVFLGILRNPSRLGATDSDAEFEQSVP